MDFQGEEKTFIPQTTDKMVEHITSLDGFGYGVSVTPMQTLTFIMLLQNNGMVKPHFVSEIKEWNRTIKKWRSSH
jgi:cell division protein FtsI (penicillin-binding protein 3)